MPFDQMVHFLKLTDYWLQVKQLVSLACLLLCRVCVCVYLSMCDSERVGGGAELPLRVLPLACAPHPDHPLHPPPLHTAVSLSPRQHTDHTPQGMCVCMYRVECTSLVYYLCYGMRDIM